MEPSPRLAAMQWGEHDPEVGAPVWGQKESSGGDKLGFRDPWVCVSLPCGTEQEPEAGSSGMAKESPPAPQCAPAPQGRALLTTPVGKVRPPMEHVPTGHPSEPH